MRLDLAAVRTSAGTRRWTLTIVATVVSAYALDLVATACGVALAASGVLAGVDGRLLLVVLAASYAIWGLGLRANLAANWALLQATGTSTNALSKGAHDIAGRRGASVRVRRWAASAGYVGTEVAKEVPYYAGAFGAALTDAVTGADALVFLAGANLGAAVYEYGLARATHAVLRRRHGAPVV